MRRLAGFIGVTAGLVSISWAQPNAWQAYDNPLVGIHMMVKPEWTNSELKETDQTGSVAFNIVADPQITVSAARQKADYPFEVWVSSEILSQLYQPGYKTTAHVNFAGRTCVKIVGQTKDKESHQEETYFSSRPPFIDQITFAAPADQWERAEKDFAEVRKTIRWTRK